MISILQRPTAWLPIVMSLAAVALPLGYVAVFGIAQEPPHDEGVAAHLWQLLMAGQIPVVLFFACKWLPRAPRHALFVLLLQAVAFVTALAPVFIFRL